MLFEPGGRRRSEAFRRADLPEGLVAFLPEDQGTQQVESRQVGIAPDAGVQAARGLAQPLRLHVEVADGQQQVGRGLIAIESQGILERTNGVVELPAEGQLATAQEVVERRHGLALPGFSILAVPACEVARALEAIGAAEVVRGRRSRAKLDRLVEDPQTFGRARRLRPDQQQGVATVGNPGLLRVRERGRQRVHQGPGLVRGLGVPGVDRQCGMGRGAEVLEAVRSTDPNPAAYNWASCSQLQELLKCFTVHSIAFPRRLERAEDTKSFGNPLALLIDPDRDLGRALARLSRLEGTLPDRS